MGLQQWLEAEGLRRLHADQAVSRGRLGDRPPGIEPLDRIGDGQGRDGGDRLLKCRDRVPDQGLRNEGAGGVMDQDAAVEAGIGKVLQTEADRILTCVAADRSADGDLAGIEPLQRGLVAFLVIRADHHDDRGQARQCQKRLERLRQHRAAVQPAILFRAVATGTQASARSDEDKRDRGVRRRR